jgi:hypothetical protein
MMQLLATGAGVIATAFETHSNLENSAVRKSAARTVPGRGQRPVPDVIVINALSPTPMATATQGGMPSPTSTLTLPPTNTATETPTETPTDTPTPSVTPSPTQLPPDACCEYPDRGACGVAANGQCRPGGTPVLNAVCTGNGGCSTITPTPTPSVTPSPTQLPPDACCEYPDLGACGVAANGQCRPGGTPVLNAVCASDGSCSTITPTPTGTPNSCTGDCDGSGDVTVNELILMVNIALGNADISTCVAGDADGSGDITINEIIGAVGFALNGCPM